MSISIDTPLLAARRFDFEYFEDVKRVWNINVRLKNSQNLVLILSKHIVTEGFWLQQENNSRLPEDLVFRGDAITELFAKIDRELFLNKKTKRVFMISVNDKSECIITTNGLITGFGNSFSWMFGKTLQEIKPWLKQHTNLKVTELNVTGVEKDKNANN